MLAVLCAAGVCAFFVGNRRLDKKLQRLGIALVLIAGIVAGLRLLFPSDREMMEKRTRQVVNAVDHQDWKALRALLDAKTIIAFPTRILAAGQDNIVGVTKEYSERYSLRSVSVTGMESEQTQTLITVSIQVYSIQDVSQGRPIISSWQFDYQQSGDQWLLGKITLLRLQQPDGEEYPF